MSDITIGLSIEESVAICTALQVIKRMMPTGPMVGRADVESVLVRLIALEKEYTLKNPAAAAEKSLSLVERHRKAMGRVIDDLRKSD